MQIHDKLGRIYYREYDRSSLDDTLVSLYFHIDHKICMISELPSYRSMYNIKA